MIASEEWSSSSSEEEIPAKVLRGDGRVCGTHGVCCRGVCGVRGVRCRGVRGQGVHCWGGQFRDSFHISQVVGHREGVEVGRNEEDIDGVSSEGVGDKHVDDGGDVGGNEEGDIVNTGSKDSENENVDGSSKDKVGENIKEGKAVRVDDGDGEDNEGVDSGLVDNVGERIGVCGRRGVRGVCGGRGTGNRRERNNNNINIE